MRKFLTGVAIGLVVLTIALGGAVADRLFEIKPLNLLLPQEESFRVGSVEQKILKEESVVIYVNERY